MQEADAIYVFPLKTPSEPRRDDKHSRLPSAEARQQLLLVLAEPRNWYTGLFAISPSADQPNIGLLFRHRGKELVLFFQDMLIQGKFGRKAMVGMLEEKGKKGI